MCHPIRTTLAITVFMGLLACGGGDEEATTDQASQDTATDVQGNDDVGLDLACQNECDELGASVCAGMNSRMECVADGECMVWSEEIPCDDGGNCAAGQCEAVAGDLDCLGISVCKGQCGEDESCKDSCYTQGSEQGQLDWTALADCIETQCGELFVAEKPAAGAQCTLTSCKDQYLICTPVGTDTCKESLSCLQACDGDNTCQGGCLLTADYDSLLEMSAILTCFEEKCPDPGEWTGCATSKCLGPVLGCH